MPAGRSESNRGSNSRLDTVYAASPGRTSGPDRSWPRAVQSAGDGDCVPLGAAAPAPPVAVAADEGAVALGFGPAALVPPPPLQAERRPAPPAPPLPPPRRQAEGGPAPPGPPASRRNARRPWSSAIASLPFAPPSM